ncbi:MAG: hypothetical protein U9P14_00395 [Gemmatimonadota bacterium]|nr:hypothetical protein [Gemmatimonadota bacterium]
MTGETRRQIEHIVPLGFAFLLRYLTVTQAAVMALAAIVYGVFGSRLLVSSGVREDERARGFSVGKISYALVVLALVLLFGERMHITAGAWAVLALGDSISNLAGRAWGRKTLPWSREKTWTGSAAFFVASWAGAFVLVVWTAAGKGIPLPGTGAVMAVTAAAAAVAAVVESLPLAVDDNITSPLAAALVLGTFL